MPINLALALQESARRRPDKPAIIAGERRFSYGELDGMANRVANGLRALGVQRGDRVAIMLPNVPEFPAIYFGVLKLGALAIPLNALLKAAEIGRILRDADAVSIFAWPSCLEEARQAVSQAPACRHLIVASPGERDEAASELTLAGLVACASPSFEMAWLPSDETAIILYT